MAQFAAYISRGLCNPRLIFPRINRPIVFKYKISQDVDSIPLKVYFREPNTWYLQCNCSRFNVFGQILTPAVQSISTSHMLLTANFPPLILHTKKARTLHLTQRFTTCVRFTFGKFSLVVPYSTLDMHACSFSINVHRALDAFPCRLVTDRFKRVGWFRKGVFPLGYSMCSSRCKTSVPARSCDSSLLVPVGGVSHETSARKLAIGCLIIFCWARMTARNRTSGLLKRWKLLVYRAGR